MENPPKTTASTAPLLPQGDTANGHQHRGWLRRIPSGLRLKTSLSAELSGAVGDLGTYIPIVLALTLVNGLDLGTALISTALYNVATAALFGVPMPVQPMKSIASVAISSSPPLTLPEIMAAGLSTASVLLFLGATGLMSTFYRLIPLPVVRGIQLSQGLSFAFSAIRYVRFDQDVTTSTSGPPRPFLAPDGGLLAAIASALLLLLLSDSRRVPAALLVFLAGLTLCFLQDPSIIRDLRLGPPRLSLVRITWDDLKVGFLRAAVPQIPLSILNSVIAVCKLSSDLFPSRDAVSATSVSVSVGVMNLVGCWFGALPVCHGAGGLAGQYKFGGRSGASVLFLGAAKMALGLLFGSSLARILGKFPIGILGAMLLFSGVELAMASRDIGTREESFVMLVCAAVSLTAGGSSAALGFVCGIAVFALLRLRRVRWRDGWRGWADAFTAAPEEVEGQPRIVPCC